MKKTLVLGASTNPSRYAYIAAQRLINHQHEVVLVGNKKGAIFGIEIQNDQPILEDIDTITLYLNPFRQEQYYDYILSLKPKRIIYNPGTENPVLMAKAKTAGIKNEVACTLVMLSIGEY